MGSKAYPEGTNHFSPSSPLFNDRQSRLSLTRVIMSISRIALGKGIIVSDVGIVSMVALLLLFGFNYGWNLLFMAYVVPYMVSRCVGTLLLSNADCALP